MDNLEYGQILTGYILNCLISRIPANIILKKKNKSGIITKISPEIKSGNFDINRYLNYEQYNDVVFKFYEVLETRLSHCKENTFYKNIQDLTITERLLTKLERLILGKAHGTYDGDRNELIIYGRKTNRNIDEQTIEEKDDIASHELLHMSSTYKKGPILLMGFSQHIGTDYSIGNGLNEGYTERLNLKYFTHKKESTAYIQERFMAEGIENIVGAEKMEQLYFQADLKGLINELEKYSTKEQVINLIKKIDLFERRDEEGLEEYQTMAKEIRVEIANMYAKKQKILLDSHQITQAEYEDNILKNEAFFIHGYKVEKTDNGYEYELYNANTGRVLTEESYNKIKNNYFSNNEGEIIFTTEDDEDTNVVHQATRHWHSYATKTNNQEELNDMLESTTETKEANNKKQ